MNKEMFDGVVRSNGETFGALAEAIGITRTTLSKKINGKADFTQPEISSIKSRYGLSCSQVDAIFFSDNVS